MDVHVGHSRYAVVLTRCRVTINTLLAGDKHCSEEEKTLHRQLNHGRLSIVICLFWEGTVPPGVVLGINTVVDGTVEVSG